MAAIRALSVLVALTAFFLIGAPLQWLLTRRLPRAAHAIPLFFCRSLLWLLKVRVEVDGTHAVGRPALTVANHVSWIDILAMGTVTPFCFLAKSEVARWPVLSAFAEVQGAVFVDRQRRRSIPGANRRMAERMREGRSVLLFPEGTTVGGPAPARFMSSHFAAARDFIRAAGQAHADGEVDVQPVAIAYSSPTAAWIGDDALVSHLWRVLCSPPLRCHIAFLPPIVYRAESDRKAIALQCRNGVAAALRRSPVVAVSEAADSVESGGAGCVQPAVTRV